MTAVFLWNALAGLFFGLLAWVYDRVAGIEPC